MYKWPLNINNFDEQDRSKISAFILDSNNRWTQDQQVSLFEKKFAEYVGCKYAIFVCNGSAANTILAQYTKDLQDPKKNKVILPSTTWQTSCSPWIREGFEPIFIDISLDDFCIDKKQLEDYVSKNYESIACVFPTSLIGFTPDIDFFIYLQNQYKIKIMFDNCENTFGLYNNQNISSYFTSTTSTYFGHQIQSIEGGFIFTNNQDEYEYFLMLRNHGMTRSLTAYNLKNDKYLNNKIDISFDFYCLGNNYRNTDINAFIGQLDLLKINKYIIHRQYIYDIFKKYLDLKKYYLPPDRPKCIDTAFCLPIICQDATKKDGIIKICKHNSIEYRPIISGFLGAQTCYSTYFKKYDISKFSNSIFLHNNGLYIGLHSKITHNDLITLIQILNKI